MRFQSVDFLLFLPVVLGLYWALPRRGQNALLLLASATFYGWVHPWFLSLLALSTATDYIVGLGIERRPTRRRRWLAVSLAVNLGLLGTFKYFDFFAESFAAALGRLGFAVSAPTLELVLPVGISFYTFQTLSYSIDVYRGRLAARRDFLDYAVFVTFFPQLVAGPIERAAALLPQFERKRTFNPEAFRDGALLMIWGYFQKTVIADNVAVVADKVFALAEPSFFVLWTGVLAFTFQIFADFSGYTNIARGVARLLGVELSQNFEHPYVSTSPTDFWRRWHISLSTWFRDYVYIPLGGSRTGRAAYARNIMITFLVSGLWHGASWNFVLWGGFWGATFLAYKAAGDLLPSVRLWRPLRVGLMFGLACFGWLLFREHDVGRLGDLLAVAPTLEWSLDNRAAAYLAFEVLLYSVPLWLHALADSRPVAARLARTSEAALLSARALIGALLLIGILLGRRPGGGDFIYFQF